MCNIKVYVTKLIASKAIVICTNHLLTSKCMQVFTSIAASSANLNLKC